MKIIIPLYAQEVSTIRRLHGRSRNKSLQMRGIQNYKLRLVDIKIVKLFNNPEERGVV